MSVTPRKVRLAERAMEMREDPDPTPVEIPGHLLEQPATFEEQMKAFIRQEVSRVALAEGEGSFEEEDDFDEEDPDIVPLSDYQVLELVNELDASYEVDPTPDPSSPAEPSSDGAAVAGSATADPISSDDSGTEPQ